MNLIAIIFPKTKTFLKYLLLITVYTCAVVWFDDHYFPRHMFFEAKELMTTTSIVIGLLLAFRTNSAYDRWWEGRKLWGQLVNEIRNFCLKCNTLLNSEQMENISQLLIAFPYILKNHLRGGATNLDGLKVDEAALSGKNAPLHIAQTIESILQQWKRDKAIDGFDLLFLDTHARSLMDITGSCERILKSPIAPSYKYIIWLWLILYLLVLPWLLTPVLDLYTIPAMIFGAYFIFALELLAEEVEEPFGTNPADLPLDSICETIKSSIHQIIKISHKH